MKHHQSLAQSIHSHTLSRLVGFLERPQTCRFAPGPAFFLKVLQNTTATE
jgi:hypothetical protein